MAVLEAVSSDERGRAETAVVAVQEHWQRRGCTADMQAQCRKLGWMASVAPATTGPQGGASAGVAVLMPSRTAPGLIPGIGADESPLKEQGSVATAYGQGIIPGGLLAISCYLRTNEVASTGNRAIITKALGAAKASGLPWVVAMDANQTPEELGGWAGELLEKAGGVIVAPREPTHFPAEGKEPRTLDYFLMSRSVAMAVDVCEVAEEYGCSPHKVVRVRLKSERTRVMIHKLRMPKTFPVQKPVGCARKPCTAAQAGWVGAKPRTKEEGRKMVEEAWEGVVAAIEHEACGVLDEVDEKGQPKRKYIGRQSGPLIVKAPLLAPRKSARHGAYLQQHAAAWVPTRLQQLKAAAEAWQRGALSSRTRQQWAKMKEAFAKHNSLMQKLIQDQDERKESRWKEIMEDVKELSIHQSHNHLKGHTEWVKEHLEKTKCRDVEEAGNSWRAWIEEQRRKGRGAVHAYVTRKEEAVETAIWTEGGGTRRHRT